MLLQITEERVERLRRDAIRTSRPPRRSLRRRLHAVLGTADDRLACEAPPRPSHSTS